MPLPWCGQTYHYPTPGGAVQIIGVTQVLGALYGVCFITESGARKRVKSPQLPVVRSANHAQQRLDKWAEKRGLNPVSQ